MRTGGHRRQSSRSCIRRRMANEFSFFFSCWWSLLVHSINSCRVRSPGEARVLEFLAGSRFQQRHIFPASARIHKNIAHTDLVFVPAVVRVDDGGRCVPERLVNGGPQAVLLHPRQLPKDVECVLEVLVRVDIHLRAEVTQWEFGPYVRPHSQNENQKQNS